MKKIIPCHSERQGLEESSEVQSWMLRYAQHDVVVLRHPERRSLEGSSQEMPWMLRYAQHDVIIKIKAKARSFCQTIKNLENGEIENQMSGESRLVPLRDGCNGGALVCLDGFRYFHRNQNIVKKSSRMDVYFRIFFQVHRVPLFVKATRRHGRRIAL